MRFRQGVMMVLAGVMLPGSLYADGSLMAPRGSIFTPRAPMFDTRTPTDAPEAKVQAASLFMDTAAAGLFAPLPDRPVDLGQRALGPMSGDSLTHLRAVIASAEAGRMGYDAVQHGAKVKPRKPPTQMTLEEIVLWIRATPGQPHAIGRYQFIPKTLARLVRKIGAHGEMRFSPALQDRLADELLKEAGLLAFRDGLMPRRTFMHNLAKIWAGLPTASGKSYYQGYAGNKATMTYARFDAEMARAFPGLG
ncbi:hypothetical protein ILP92_01575 [Maribius pontilimi]|uniref:Uncharacterized protein n=1 Tax=Palleronia pontilimi TaxID=1964209 RepID=A0A934IEU6_9RHOB|nr:hypothetical protein [Palleronia pontilimi]MBJ3761441.1 hypothetical protein [Palleronia pontilimi]